MDKTYLKAKYEQTKKRLELYYKAEEAVLVGGQHYIIGSRTLTRADLAEIRKNIKALKSELAELEALLSGNGRRAIKRVIPRDV